MRLSVRISNWIRAQVKGARAKGIILGLSGGIDSAVVAVLAKRAVGGNALGVIMPCHSASDDEADARLVARRFGISTRKIDLSRAFDALASTLSRNAGRAVADSAARLAMANLKPRLRMIVLYYLANRMNYLVAGTGNRAEISVGYFTKYGDGAVDILPIGSLLKREVRALAVELGIPEKIITKPPSAGLWPGQTDEGEMEILYDELDSILAGEGGDKASVRKVRSMAARSEHKRRMPAVFR
ncbi:MAG: NAD(+) synthase [Planctomycetota bacterium]|nr:NAD(+) synthase [Planctomycetota bacterium]